MTLFPMAHLGEARFDEEVFAEAVGHDALLHEGVSSRISRRLARSYRAVIYREGHMGVLALIGRRVIPA